MCSSPGVLAAGGLREEDFYKRSFVFLKILVP